MNEALRERLSRYEIAEMGRRFPQFKLFSGDGKLNFVPRGAAFWGGRLKTNFGTEYSLAVVYPVNYPNGQIKAFISELMNTPNYDAGTPPADGSANPGALSDFKWTLKGQPDQRTASQLSNLESALSLCLRS